MKSNENIHESTENEKPLGFYFLVPSVLALLAFAYLTIRLVEFASQHDLFSYLHNVGQLVVAAFMTLLTIVSSLRHPLLCLIPLAGVLSLCLIY